MNQEKIGKFIATCRKENGYTQASLAEQLVITDRAISKWENGKSMPDASIMLELCELLKINVNELLTVVAFLSMIMMGCFIGTQNKIIAIILCVLGSVITLMGVFYGLKIEHDAGYYECPECKERYVPTMKAVVMAPHYGTTRKMKCPHCGAKGYHKKVLTK